MHRLETKRLLLRPYTEADREAFVVLVTDPDIMRNLDGPSESPSVLYERMLPGRPDAKDISWAITLRSDDSFVGHIFLTGLHREQPPEIGFVLHAEYWGRGYATEAANVVLGQGQSVLGFERVEATVDSDHEASKGVLSKIGMCLVCEEYDEKGAYLRYGTQGGTAPE